MNALWDFKDYYKILGLDVTAPFAEIRAAYWRLAKKFHPDLSTFKDAEARMKLINEAYAVLRDSQKRASYDLMYRLNQARKASYARQAGTRYSTRGPDPARQRYTRQAPIKYGTAAAGPSQPRRQRSTQESAGPRNLGSDPFLAVASIVSILLLASYFLDLPPRSATDLVGFLQSIVLSSSLSGFR
jgi:curved DNA-binding protein CbpA